MHVKPSANFSEPFPTPFIREIELRFLVNCFLQLSLLPYFHILPISAANQPVGALFAVLAMFLGYRIAKSPIALLMATILAIVSIWTMFTLISEPSHGGAIMQGAIGYFTNALALIFAINYQRYYSRRLLRINLLVLAFVALVQFGVFSYSAAAALNDILSHLITGFESVLLKTRGVQLFTPEPSFAAQAISLYFFLWLLRDFPSARNRDRAVYGICFLILLVTSGSGTLLSFILFGGITYVIFSGRKAILNLFSFLVLGVFAYYLIIETGLAPERLTVLFSFLPQLFKASNFESLLIAFTYIGGFRFAVIVIGLGTPLYAPLGNGIAQWSWGLVEMAHKFGIDFQKLPLNRNEQKLTGNKPNSFASTFVYETGWIAYAILALLCASVWQALQQHRHAHHYRLLACAVAVGLLQILGNGLAFLSSPWLLVAMAYQRPETWGSTMVWTEKRADRDLFSRP